MTVKYIRKIIKPYINNILHWLIGIINNNDLPPASVLLKMGTGKSNILMVALSENLMMAVSLHMETAKS